MDPKKFQQAIEQHADWYHCAGDSANSGKRSTNPTARIQIREIKAPRDPCEACGQALESVRRVLLQRRPDHGGWTERCGNCRRYRNPITGEFSVGQTEAIALLRQKHNRPQRGHNGKQSSD